MCGIAGIVASRQHQIGKRLFNLLTDLNYRGYNGWGFAVLRGDSIYFDKDSGDVEKADVKRFDIFGDTGIAHTRWPTHGKDSKINAHPHLDCSKTIAVVHNGTIDNFADLKVELEENGHMFLSDTDTEVVVHLLEEYRKDNGMKRSLEMLVKKLEGEYALGIISTAYPNTIFAVRNHKPLVVGIGAKENYICSDVEGLLRYTQKIKPLNESEYAVVTPTSIEIRDFNGKIRERKAETIPLTFSSVNKNGFAYFMEKEIEEQPIILKKCITQNKKCVEEHAKMLYDNLDSMHLIASGSSKHALEVFQRLLIEMVDIHVPVIDAGEYKPTSDCKVLFTVSQSGETADVIEQVERARRKNEKLRVFSLVNKYFTDLEWKSDVVARMYAGPERSVVATKSYVASIAYLLMLAGALGEYSGNIDKKEVLEALEEAPYLARKILRKKQRYKQLAKWVDSDWETSKVIYIGNGINYPTAKEGWLKLIEITYGNCHVFSGSSLKHGPLSTLDRKAKVILLAPNDRWYSRTLSNAMEIHSRDASLLILAEENPRLLEDMQKVIQHRPVESLSIPRTAWFLQPITYVIPLQCIAYYTCIIQGKNPDKPRHLSKTITVK